MADLDVKIITFGGATQDVFLTGKALHARRDVRTRDYVEQFPLGAKIAVDNVYFDTGGGATNAAVTFTRQGLQAEYIGKIGHDPAGAEVMRVLKKEGVATERVVYHPRLSTGYSTILLAANGERTILTYRGAGHELTAKDIPIRNLEADWFYITSLAGNLDLLRRLLKHANTRGIQVALAGVCPYVIGTNGSHGSIAASGGKLYQAGEYVKARAVDRLGAGDAFGSGFVAGIAKGLVMEDALSLAAANASSVVAQVGAKTGILKTPRVKRMKLKISSL
jgi:sugar/nucleoside kinase (ribokinase family)